MEKSNWFGKTWNLDLENYEQMAIFLEFRFNIVFLEMHWKLDFQKCFYKIVWKHEQELSIDLTVVWNDSGLITFNETEFWDIQARRSDVHIYFVQI